MASQDPSAPGDGGTPVPPVPVVPPARSAYSPIYIGLMLFIFALVAALIGTFTNIWMEHNKQDNLLRQSANIVDPWIVDDVSPRHKAPTPTPSPTP